MLTPPVAAVKLVNVSVFNLSPSQVSGVSERILYLSYILSLQPVVRVRSTGVTEIEIFDGTDMSDQ